MPEAPNPFSRKMLTRASAVGVVLAMVEIVLFLILWTVLGNAGADQFAQLILSVCLPPALIAAGIGVYLLVVRPPNPP